LTGLNIDYVLQIIPETMSAIVTSAANICMICDAELGQTNICTTKCGHNYCLTCLITYYTETSYECPECAAPLQNSTEIEPEQTPEDEADEWYDPDSVGCIDDVAKMLEESQVSMLDVLIYYSGRYNSRTIEYRPSRRHNYHIHYIERMEELIQTAFNEVDRIHQDRSSSRDEAVLMINDETEVMPNAEFTPSDEECSANAIE
jgi:hypothetical protein